MISADLNIILPEIVLAGFALLGLLGAVYTSKDKAAGVLVWVTAVVMVLLAAWVAMSGDGTTNIAFHGMFIDDSFARALRKWRSCSRRRLSWSCPKAI